MPVNRFDESSNQRYVSQFVPQQYIGMPLDQLTKLAKDHSDKHKNALDDISKTKDILKINADPRNVAYRDNYLKETNKQLEGLTDEIVKNGYTPELQGKWTRLKNSVMSDPNRLAVENAYKNYQDFQKDAEANKKTGVYSDIYNDYTGEGNPNEPTPYDYKGMKTKLDYIPVMDKAIDGLKADSKAWEGYRKDSSGKPIINEFGQLTKSNGEREELTGKKLKEIANTVAPTFFQSKEAQYYIDEAYGRPMPEFNNLSKEQQDDLLENATSDIIRRGSTQLFSKTSSGMDLQNLPKHALTKEEDVAPGMGQALPGSAVYNLTDEIPKELKDAIIVKDGKAEIDWNGLTTNKGKPFIGGKIYDPKDTKPNDIEMHKKLAKYIDSAAKSINYKGDIKSDNYNDILTQYMNGAKTVSYDYQMIPNENEAVKNSIISYPDNYTYTDETGKPIVERPTAEKNPLTKQNLNVGRRVYKDGQARIEIEYMDGDEPKKMYAQPLATEDRNYHNSIAEIQKDGLNFYKTGKPSESNLTKQVTNKFFNKAGYNGLKPVSTIELPNGNIAITLGDKNNRLEQKYEILTPEGRETFDNLPQMMEAINKDWFQTTQGKGQAGSIAPKKDNYNNLIDED